MRVAVLLFGDEVSPRFGFSRGLEVNSIRGGVVESRERIQVGHLPAWRLPDFLASLKIDRVICGGIHRRHQAELEYRGIEVTWGVIGPAEEAVSALIAGTLRRDQFVGCDPRGRRGRRRHRRGRGEAHPGSGPLA